MLMWRWHFFTNISWNTVWASWRWNLITFNFISWDWRTKWINSNSLDSSLIIDDWWSSEIRITTFSLLVIYTKWRIPISMSIVVCSFVIMMLMLSMTSMWISSMNSYWSIFSINMMLFFLLVSKIWIFVISWLWISSGSTLIRYDCFLVVMWICSIAFTISSIDDFWESISILIVIRVSSRVNDVLSIIIVEYLLALSSMESASISMITLTFMMFWNMNRRLMIKPRFFSCWLLMIISLLSCFWMLMFKSTVKVRIWTHEIISLKCSSTSSLISMCLMITFVHDLMSSIINNFIISLFCKVNSSMSLMEILFLCWFLCNWFIFIEEWSFLLFLNWFVFKIFDWNLLLVWSLFHDLSCGNSCFLLSWNFWII